MAKTVRSKATSRISTAGKRHALEVAIEGAADLGPTVTISASVPKSLVAQVRERVGTREFSRFVTRSLDRELMRLNRLQFVADVEARSGSLEPAELRAARKLLGV